MVGGNGCRRTDTMDPITGEMHCGRDRQNWPLACRTPGSHLLPSRIRVQQPCRRMPRGRHDVGHRPQGPDEAGYHRCAVRRRSDICNSSGTPSSRGWQDSASKDSSCAFGAVRRQLRGRGHGCNVQAEKELARLWYGRRKDRRAERLGSRSAPSEEVRSAGQGGQEPWIEKLGLTAARASAPGGNEERRPIERSSCAPDHEHGEKEKRQATEAQVRDKLELLRERHIERGRRHQQAAKRPLQSGPQLSAVWQEDVCPALEVREKVCQGPRTRTWSPRPTIQGYRSEPPDCLRSSAQPSEVSLPHGACAGAAFEEQAREGSLAVHSCTASDASSSTGPGGMDSCVVDHAPRGPIFQEAVRRRSKRSSTCHDIPEVDARAAAIHREHPQEGRWKGKRRRCRRSESEQGREGQRPQSQGHQREDRRQGQHRVLNTTRSSEKPAVLSADNASSQVFPIVQSFCESHGSFGRFWKLLKSSNFNQRLGPKTPSNDLKGVQLFPSLLVLPAQVGESKGARRRARRRGRSEAWCYAEMLWAYFTFLHGGSPHKHCDQQRPLSKAVANPWTSLHATYAGSLHDQINRYIRLQCDDAPLSRGILKLSELVKIVRNSDYTHNLTCDKLSRVAKPVKPERMSLPSVAGIIEPITSTVSTPWQPRFHMTSSPTIPR